MKNFIKVALISTSLSGLASAQSAPGVINYQGFVTDAAGAPIGQNAAVNRKIVFRIYDADAGGNLIWTEEHTATIVGGRFSVLLGQGINGTGTAAGEARPSLVNALGGSQRYIGITVDDGNNSIGNEDLEISPRQRFTSSAYALRSAATDYVAVGSFRQQDTNYGQGAWVEWNRDGGGGRSYMMNQRGLGSMGGISFGELEGAIGGPKTYVETMSLSRDGNLQIDGNLQVDGTISFNGGINLTGKSLGAQSFSADGNIIAQGYSTGATSHVTGSLIAPGVQQGLYTAWNHDVGSGSSYFMNQQGLGSEGGFSWGNLDGTNGSYDEKMNLSASGDLQINGALFASGNIISSRFTTGVTSHITGSLVGQGVPQGLYTAWDYTPGSRTSYFMNQPGAQQGAGGFSWGNFNGANGIYDEKMNLTASGDLQIDGQLTAGGTSSFASLIAADNILAGGYSTGATSHVTGSLIAPGGRAQGLYTAWNHVSGSGASYFMNQQGLGAEGGFSWGNLDETTSFYDEKMNLTASGDLQIDGQLTAGGTSSFASLVAADNILAGGFLTGATSHITRSLIVPGGRGEGLYTAWNHEPGSGASYFMNQRGLGSGGFSWGNLDGTNSDYDQKMHLGSNGDLQVNGKLNTNSDITVAGKQVPTAEEKLRIVRGTVSDISGAVTTTLGTAGITAGVGFRVSQNSIGTYHITFDTPFSGIPSVTATFNAFSFNEQAPERDGGPRDAREFPVVWDASNTGFYFRSNVDGGGGNLNTAFSFIAIGPR